MSDEAGRERALLGEDILRTARQAPAVNFLFARLAAAFLGAAFMPTLRPSPSDFANGRRRRSWEATIGMNAATKPNWSGQRHIMNVRKSRPLVVLKRATENRRPRSHGKHTPQFTSFRVCSRVFGECAAGVWQDSY
jgi:hypothetical protein